MGMLVDVSVHKTARKLGTPIRPFAPNIVVSLLLSLFTELYCTTITILDRYVGVPGNL